MDENSCENETSESVDGQKAKETENAPRLEDVGVRIGLDGIKKPQNVSERCGSSFDASVSGPSTGFAPSSEDGGLVGGQNVQAVFEQNQREPAEPEEPSAPVEESGRVPQSEPPSYEIQSRVRLAPGVEEELAARRPSVGPPPSYSFVMKQKRKFKSVPSPDPLLIDRPPPPTYAGSHGVYMPQEERIRTFQNATGEKHFTGYANFELEMDFIQTGVTSPKTEAVHTIQETFSETFSKETFTASFAEPIWRSHSQPALCHQCGILVLTSTHSHDSVATHVAALALCLFGCWPCCLLPYCMNVCKNTYHHCPICQTFLGLYRPW